MQNPIGMLIKLKDKAGNTMEKSNYSIQNERNMNFIAVPNVWDASPIKKNKLTRYTATEVVMKTRIKIGKLLKDRRQKR